MISIQRYLKDKGAGKPADTDPNTTVLLGMCLSLVESIENHVLTGDSARQFRSEIAELTAPLRPDIEAPQATQFQDSARRILSAHAATVGETAHRTAEEMQHIVGTLSQALSLVANGGDRSVSRLQRIQETLQRTSLIQDVRELRASLSRAILLIKEESIQAKEAHASDMAALQADVTKVRGFAAGKPGRQLPGRPEGIRELSAALRTVKPDEAVFITAFVFDSVKAIIQRFGPDVVDELIMRVIKERIQPVAPENTAYRWTPYSLVGVFHGTPDLPRLKFKMAELNRGPLVHHVELGNRTAVLKLGLSCLVAQGSPGAEDRLIGELDRFTGIGA